MIILDAKKSTVLSVRDTPALDLLLMMNTYKGYALVVFIRA